MIDCRAGLVNELNNTVKVKQQHCHSIEIELNAQRLIVQRQAKALAAAERARDRKLCDSQMNATKVDAVKTEHELMTKTIADLTTKLTNIEMRLKHAKQKHDALTAERNALRKSLETTVAERDEAREKLRVNEIIYQNHLSISTRDINSFQLRHGDVDKLQLEIERQNAELLHASKQIDKHEKEKNTMKADVQSANIAVQHIRTELAEKEHELTALYKSLDAAAKQNSRATQQLQTLQKEKDLLNGELMKRNDAVRHANEQLQVMQIALDRSEFCVRWEDDELLNFVVLFQAKYNTMIDSRMCDC